MSTPSAAGAAEGRRSAEAERRRARFDGFGSDNRHHTHNNITSTTEKSAPLKHQNMRVPQTGELQTELATAQY